MPLAWGGAWTLPQAVTVLEPLASALDFAHRQGVIHRDVKPSNVLFTEQGRLVLSDFGIARMLESSTLMSQAGLIVGTPMYMSPEQADGQRVGPASDRYSLGVVAYGLLTSRPPFQAETPLALLRAHIDKPLPPPRSLNPDLPEAVEAMLFKIMAKDPGDRFASATEFVAALRSEGPTRMSASQSIRLPYPPAPPGTPAGLSGNVTHSSLSVSRREMLIGLGAAVVASTAIGALVWKPSESETGRAAPTAVAAAKPTQAPTATTVPVTTVAAAKPTQVPAVPTAPATAVAAVKPSQAPAAPAQPTTPTAGGPVVQLTGHTGTVQHVAFSPDGQMLATASYDKTAQLWRVP